MAREAAWIAQLAPEFRRFGAEPPGRLNEIYKSFVEDDDMLAMLLKDRPKVVSFHFGLPPAERIAALKNAGIALLATATNLLEARAIAAAGIDAVVACGSYEAGGHQGMFDPEVHDDHLGTVCSDASARKDDRKIPVIAAGGVMDGAGIAACLALGAGAVQLGTAFIACPESAADAGYRAALLGPSAQHTVVTLAISGRPARCLANRFTAARGGRWGHAGSGLPDRLRRHGKAAHTPP